jgi:hypothetical protein
MSWKASYLFAVLLVSPGLFAARAPDIPTGSKIFLENKGTSDESLMFTELFREKLSKDETSGSFIKPGFPVVERKEDATYTLRFIFLMRENQKSFGEGPQEHARVNVWLLDSASTVVWEHNYDCVRVFREPARECYQHISDDLKAAQVNAEGKRAGFLGWRQHGTSRLIEQDRAQVSRSLPQNHEPAPTSTAKLEPSMPQTGGQSTIGTSVDGNPTIRHDGVTLSRVVSGGPADQAGIRAGDVILAIDDHYLFTAQEMNEEIQRHKPGATISVRYRRYSTIYAATVVVGTAE